MNMLLGNTVRAPARPRHFREGSIEVCGISRLHELKPDSQRAPRDFCSLQHLRFRAFALAAGLPEGSDLGHPRNGLLELFQTLTDELRREKGQPRDIATRPRKARDESARDSHRDNWEGPGRLLDGQGGDCGGGHDDVNLERNQLGRESGEPLELPFGRSVFDHEVAALDVPQVTEALEEGL
jgi:hypothetical protein